MSFNWESFKSALGYFSNKSVLYIDDEGSEIPIDCECEFQEALRLAKMNKNSLKFVLYDKAKSNETMCMDHCQLIQFAANPSEKGREIKKKNVTPMSHNSCCKENTCHSHGDVAPEWFSLYMKKFQKELIHELKSYIHDTVRSTVEKEKKLSHTKSETGESICEKNKISFSTVSTQGKKRVLERDLIDHRQMRLPKKMLAIGPEQSVIDRAKLLPDKNLRLIERKQQCKTKCFGADKKDTSKKSASFLRCSELNPRNSSKFSLLVYVANDGNVRWSSPELKCTALKGLFPKEVRIILPRLYPMEKHFIVLKGNVSETPGFHYFKCVVVDDLEILSPELSCWTRVDSVEPVQKISSDSVSQKDVTTQIDFENEVISSIQNKTEENINEIERRLQDIDLLQTSTYVEISPEEATQINKSDKLQTGCDLMQDSENTDIPIQSEVLLERNELGKVTPNTMYNLKNDTEKGKSESPIKQTENKKNGEMESSSDSELSIIFISEEEDNFCVVPSESFSPIESTNEEKNPLVAECNETPTNSVEETESVVKKEMPLRTHQGEATPNENFRQSQSSPTRSRCSPFGEEISKPKKMKSKSTEYCFTADNLTQPTFTHIPGFFEGRPSRFTFTGEKEEKSTKSDPQETVTVPKTDELGRPIYAVISNGYCLPVEDMLKSREGRMSPEREARKNAGREQGIPNRPERQNERPSDVPPVNILPTVLNGASNVASYAFNTAKSVINNLQSAFVTEGKTELGEPAYEDKVKPLTEAMLMLYEMGFMNFETNLQLLTLYCNDLSKVVDELIRLSSRRTHLSFT